MPRFVILEHDHPFQHWDFMLESGNRLRTWRLLEKPTPERAVKAEPLGEHRIAYLDYEGPVSDNRGTVSRWDAGKFTWDENTSERVIVVLEGQRCRGRGLLDRHSTGEWWFTLVDSSAPLSGRG